MAEPDSKRKRARRAALLPVPASGHPREQFQQSLVKASLSEVDMDRLACEVASRWALRVTSRISVDVLADQLVTEHGTAITRDLTETLAQTLLDKGIPQSRAGHPCGANGPRPLSYDP